MRETKPSPFTGGPADDGLSARVLGCVPIGQQAFSRLLGLLDIRTSEAIPSACVTLGGRSRLLLNLTFLAGHCRTDEALSMLVMHELFHILLGHTRLFERITPAQNLAFDALINAQLCLLFPDPAHTALFRNLYAPDQPPWALLRPPEGWGGNELRWLLPGEAGRLHRALYTESSVTFAELFGLLSRELQAADGELGTGEALLGNHGPEAGEGCGADPEVLREIRDIVARWPLFERRSGRDDGGTRVHGQLRLARARRAAVGVIRRALWPLLDLVSGGAGLPRPGERQADTLLPFSSGQDRRAELRALMGEEPLFFRGRAQAPGIERQQRVHLYVDVSGSMAGELPLLEWLHPRIHLFSTEIEEIDPEELRKGEVTSAWGTDIACVTTHMIEQRVRRAVILTDGWVGAVSGEHAARLARRGVRVNSVITRGGDSEFANVFRGRVSRLPELT